MLRQRRLKALLLGAEYDGCVQGQGSAGTQQAPRSETNFQVTP